MTKFWVRGGIYTDMTFTVVQPGTEEEYGPFTDRCKAISEWKGRMFAKVDICPHRLTIVEEDAEDLK
jgi:hypothetical protein